ncbi:MAG: hypothetical protein JW895_01320 [Thermoleophilaceae bacterium]|nr:hypothetical protein [Thermoleophilaceae bacterium]
MKLCLAAVLVACLAAAANASAATMTVTPRESCYSSGETVTLAGEGFTPNGKVSIARDGQTLDPLLNLNPTGAFTGDLTLYLRSGKANRTYTATDTTDPTIVATSRLLVVAPSVTIRPADLDVGLRARIGAKGFATGRTLYAHVFRTADRNGKALKGQKPRNLRIGSLKTRCGKLLARRKLFSKRAPLGDYTIQFDTYRRYKEKRPVRFLYAAPVTLERRNGR